MEINLIQRTRNIVSIIFMYSVLVSLVVYLFINNDTDNISSSKIIYTTRNYLINGTVSISSDDIIGFQPIYENKSYVFSAFFDNRHKAQYDRLSQNVLGQHNDYLIVRVFFFAMAIGQKSTRGFPEYCLLTYPDGHISGTPVTLINWYQLSLPRYDQFITISSFEVTIFNNLVMNLEATYV